MEMLVGVGASRVRDLFDTAKKLLPRLFLLMKLMPSVGFEAWGAWVVTMSVSKRSTKFWSRWMVFTE